MKMKITPDRATILTHMEAIIGGERQLLSDDESALAKLTSKELKIYNQYQEKEAAGYRQRIQQRTQYIAERETQLALLKAHEAPRVLVEIDI